MQIFGIDVSRWQGNFNFAQAKKEGVKFVILRAAYSCPPNGGKDANYDSNYAKVKAEGLGVGVYQYSIAKSVEEAINEANWLVDNCLKGKTFEYPIYFDIEDSAQTSLGRRKCTDIVKAWCNTIYSKGYLPGVYSYVSFTNNNLYDSELRSYEHWIAQYSTQCTYIPASLLNMWQFGGETNLLRSNVVAGVVCDQNYCYVDYPAIVKEKGLNGYPKSNLPSYMHRINGYNIPRTTDALIVYNKGKSTGTNKYGFEVTVKDGLVVSNPKYGKHDTKINNCMVISGHGTAGNWMLSHLCIGAKVHIKDDVLVVDSYPKTTKTGHYIFMDTQRLEDYLVFYTKGKNSGTNIWGTEARVENHKVVEIRKPGKGSMSLDNGWVLSGHGEASEWIQKNLRVGSKVSRNGNILYIKEY